MYDNGYRKKIAIFLTIILCGNTLHECFPLTDQDMQEASDQVNQDFFAKANHGWGIIERIENNSDFPIVVSFSNKDYRIGANGGNSDNIQLDPEPAKAQTFLASLGMMGSAALMYALNSQANKAVKKIVGQERKGLIENPNELDKEIQNRRELKKQLEDNPNDEKLKKQFAEKDAIVSRSLDYRANEKGIDKHRQKQNDLSNKLLEHKDQDSDEAKKIKKQIDESKRTQVELEARQAAVKVQTSGSVLQRFADKHIKEGYDKQVQDNKDKAAAEKKKDKFAAEKKAETIEKAKNATSVTKDEAAKKIQQKFREKMITRNAQSVKMATISADGDTKEASRSAADRGAGIASAKSIGLVALAVGGLGAASAGLAALTVSAKGSFRDTLQNMLPFDAPTGAFRVYVRDRPVISGFAQQRIENFNYQTSLKLSRLMNLGAAWLQTPLATPMSTSIMFRAQVEDAANLQIVFGSTKLSPAQYVWKVIIGGFNNTKAVIMKGDCIVAEVPVEQNALAAIPPGMHMPYWVSVDNGLIVAGAGAIPGENIIIAWADPAPPAEVDRIGFSNFKTNVEIVEVQLGPPIKATKQSKVYTAIEKPGVLSVGMDAPLWLDKPLREDGRGCVTFEARGQGQVVLNLKSDDSQGVISADKASVIQVSFGANNLDGISLWKMNEKGEYEETVLATPVAFIQEALDPDQWKKFWVSLFYDYMVIGHGEPGEKIMAILRIDQLASMKKIGFFLNDASTGEIQNVSIGSPVQLGMQVAAGFKQRDNFAGVINVAFPFSYHFDQKGQQIECYDAIAQETWYPGKTPQQAASYFFRLIIKPDGTPEIGDWSRQPKNAQVFLKNLAVFGARTIIGTTLSAAAEIGNVPYQDGDPVGMALSAVNAAASIASASAFVAGSVGVATLEANNTFGYRPHDNYVFTEKIQTSVRGKAGVIPQEAQDNKTLFDDKMHKLEQFNPGIARDYEYYISILQQAIMLITHPVILGQAQDKVALKNKLFGMIKQVYDQGIQHVKNMEARNAANTPLKYDQYGIPETRWAAPEMFKKQIVALLVEARENAYLLDRRDEMDLKRKTLWTGWIQQLIQELFEKGKDLTVRPLFGEYIWLSNIQLPQPGRGSVYFEASGLSDIFVGLIPQPQDVRNTDVDFYECVFGGMANQKTFIRTYSLGHSVATVSSDDNINAALTPNVLEKFWVSVNDGVVKLGHGPWGTGKVLEWVDPYPIKTQYLGFSTWAIPVTFANIKVGPPVTNETDLSYLVEVKQKGPSAIETAATALEKEKAATLALSFEDITKSDKLAQDSKAEKIDILSTKKTDFDELAYDELSYDPLTLEGWDYTFGPPPVLAERKAARQVAETGFTPIVRAAQRVKGGAAGQSIMNAQGAAFLAKQDKHMLKGEIAFFKEKGGLKSALKTAFKDAKKESKDAYEQEKVATAKAREAIKSGAVSAALKKIATDAIKKKDPAVIKKSSTVQSPTPAAVPTGVSAQAPTTAPAPPPAATGAAATEQGSDGMPK